MAATAQSGMAGDLAAQGVPEVSRYIRPHTLEDALAVLSHGPLTVAAGCTDLFPATEMQSLPGPVLDLCGIPDLRGIEETPKGWRIGATTTWSDIVVADLPPAFDMLKQAAREVGSLQIQNAGTVAGNLCNASPAADGVPPLLALDAWVDLASEQGGRRLPLAEFLTGPRKTGLLPGELVVSVSIPRAAGQGTSRFRKLGARKYLVISVVMVAGRIEAQAGRVTHAALAVGACSPVATRLPEVEARLIGHPLAGLGDAIETEWIRSAIAPISDLRADSDYREVAAAELARRVLADLATASPESSP